VIGAMLPSAGAEPPTAPGTKAADTGGPTIADVLCAYRAGSGLKPRTARRYAPILQEVERFFGATTTLRAITQSRFADYANAIKADGTRAPATKNSYISVSSCCQLGAKCSRLTRPLCSSRITSLHRSYGSIRPSAAHRYSRLVVVATCASPLTAQRLVPAVPHKSLDQLHAPSTPAAACPVIRHPTSLSQEMQPPLVSTTLG
jgi:hypothetical protein